MDEISNKTLAILLIGAIVISLGGTLISLNRLARIRLPGITGFVTDTATVDVTITETTEVNWTTSTIDWGSGTVVYSKRCELNSYDASFDSANCTAAGFSVDTDGLVLENTGNKNVSLNISTGKNAADFIGGTSPVYQWNATELEGAATCTGGLDGDSSWQTASTIHTVVCTNFQCDNDYDTIHFDVKVEIPDDAVGAKSDTITATAEAI